MKHCIVELLAEGYVHAMDSTFFIFLQIFEGPL